MHNNLFDEAIKVPPTDHVAIVPDEAIFADTTKPPVINDAYTPPAGAYNQNVNQPLSGDVSMNIGATIPAPLAIEILDKAAGAIVYAACSLAGLKMKKSQLNLTAGEKNMLEKPTEAYLNTLNVRMSPLEQFLLAWGGIYAGKIIAVYSDQHFAEPKTEVDLNDLNEIPKKRGVKPGQKRGSYKKTNE